MMDSGVPLMLIVSVLIIGVLLIVVIALTKKASPQLDVNKYRLKWLAVDKQLKRDEPSSYQLAVLNGDKLVDQALRDAAVKGETMGERLKTAKDTFSDINAIWTAHKLRNRIAHETDAQVSFEEARRALASFKQALKDIGAI
ncbi:MAG: hypothetical protein ACHQTE_01115 [Candidatus Saccharimonadales bacterium]